MTSPRTSPTNWATLEDGQLIVAVAQGDKDALTEIVSRHLNAVIHFALRYVGHRAEAEDVAQETFIRLWKNAANWEPQGFSFRSWLYRIAYNLCIDELRKRKRKPVTDVGNEELTAPGDQPDDGLYRAQQQQQVNVVLYELPERQRTAIALCVYQGLSNRDAAQVMEISIEALESLLSRARRTLRNKMTENQS
ncbi:MAG: RNA polymerase sigma factor [Gammaproteobacteria bacterium]|jgi:RNA polymerase sigma-70 factor, ECF subfamily